MGPGDLQVGEDRHDIPGQQHQRVGVDGLGLAGAPVATQVRDHDLEPRRGQRRDLVPPEPPGVGKAVQQHDRPPLPGDLILDTHPVDVYPAHTASLSRNLGADRHPASFGSLSEAFRSQSRTSPLVKELYSGNSSAAVAARSPRPTDVHSAVSARYAAISSRFAASLRYAASMPCDMISSSMVWRW